MKKIAFLTNESLIFGVHRTGVADVVDGIATSIAGQFQVTIILYSNETPSIKLPHKGVELFWFSELFQLENFLLEKSYDVIHNFAEVELIKIVPKSVLKIYTIDQKQFVLNKTKFLNGYDVLTTVSKEYASSLVNEDDELGKFLREKGLHGITNGISSDFFNPENQLFMDLPYNNESVYKKRAYKRKIVGEDTKPLFLFAGRLVSNKGVQNIIQCLNKFENSNFVIYGAGDLNLTKQLTQYKGNNLIFINEPLDKKKTLFLLAASDYFLLPSVEEPCGLMPMLASVFGAIPIVSSVGGLKDNFNQKNSIVVNNNLQEAIAHAEKLYESEVFEMFQQKVMNEDRSWKVRVQPYVELYNKKDLN